MLLQKIFFGTLKTEWVDDEDYKTKDQARTIVFYYIETFYNRRRRHSHLDYLSPIEFEARRAS
jgi:transposase InsO family protein